jgi:uncharacterized protein (TIGR03086 family)
MTDVHVMHRRAGELLIDMVKQVRDDHLDRPTPCSEWSVRDLLHHIAWSNLWVGPLVNGEALADVAPRLEGDVLGDDAVSVTVHSIEECSDAFDRGVDREVHLSRGPAPAREYCAERMNDLTVHNWDLGKGIGTEVLLDPECMETVLHHMRPFEAELRRSGELGPDVYVPRGADLQTRYLGFFGRRADWSPPS